MLLALCQMRLSTKNYQIYKENKMATRSLKPKKPPRPRSVNEMAKRAAKKAIKKK